MSQKLKLSGHASHPDGLCFALRDEAQLLWEQGRAYERQHDDAMATFYFGRARALATQAEELANQEMQSKIGIEIKNLRQLRNVSFVSLAKMAAISKGNLSKIENGKGNPTIETLVKIAHVLNAKIESFVKL